MELTNNYSRVAHPGCYRVRDRQGRSMAGATNIAPQDGWRVILNGSIKNPGETWFCSTQKEADEKFDSEPGGGVLNRVVRKGDKL